MLLQPKISIGNHNDLLSMLTKGMQATTDLNTAALGDRSLYIGMSDIGRYLECPRATLANKLFSTHDQPLEHLLPLQRGHWFVTVHFSASYFLLRLWHTCSQHRGGGVDAHRT